MFSKFLSRRFLLTAAVVVLEIIGVDLPIEVIGGVATYVLGESCTDAARVFNHRDKGE